RKKMSGELAYQQRKQNAALPRALTKSTPESVSEEEPPEPDHEPKRHPPARKEPEKRPQGDNGSNAKEEPPNQAPTSGTEAKEVLKPEAPVEKEEKHPHPEEHLDQHPPQAEQQEKESATLPPALTKETIKPDHPPAKEAGGHLPSQPPPPVEEFQQQKKQAAQWPPK
ncbi:UNVERIFIED_CONTAM: hypothetical protein K2H54_025871, partial [Gekko kuhli]